MPATLTYRSVPPDPCPWPGTPVSRVQAGALLISMIDPIPPTIASLNPASAAIGDPSFTLHVIGANFRANSVINWNGSPEPTTYVSPTELTTQVDMSTATTPTAIPVTVETFDRETAPLTFDLQAAS
jgi:hypothetical protein